MVGKEGEELGGVANLAGQTAWEEDALCWLFLLLGFAVRLRT